MMTLGSTFSNALTLARRALEGLKDQRRLQMPTMSNLRRRKIQARQRKIANADKRMEKAVKKANNAKRKTA
jgi:hypothetical protein